MINILLNGEILKPEIWNQKYYSFHLSLFVNFLPILSRLPHNHLFSELSKNSVRPGSTSLPGVSSALC